MKFNKLTKIITAGLALALATIGFSQDADAQDGFEIQGVLSELNLSEEQTTQVESILKEARESRREIFEKHGIEKGERPDRSTMKEAMGELKAARAQTDSRLAEVLDEDQLAKFKSARKSAAKKGFRARKEKRNGKSDF
ncbi:Spy/CpxP family protein refolding chaperone [Pelagicoccus albus]|uniref:Spy/CpxP family protein refolding chaperone n=1 Tax=Pelagicoccus albus TaxID=415222 RepID=A0A7X1B7Z1_9BACT|nr:Spy/CpxP family protein refolding chaperone [Pelagicoccus albus]MBC2607331.1 Spy/CpxP family protein refolding chaperone [Pelagicoccus albus]